MSTATIPPAVAHEPPPITKLIVAVHGIGDQFRYATIQSAAQQIAHYCGVSMPFPLGGFHPAQGRATALRFDTPAPPLREIGPGVGFTEVFWADLHKEAQETENTIEESKVWAQSMVERMKGFDLSPTGSQAGKASESVNYELTSTVVAEMIETIGVLENLCFIAAKAGVLKFDLRRLLDDYLGAVQLVAEFLDYRGKIVGRFYQVMRELAGRGTAVQEIHLITHSEGTVVSFYGLLTALAGISDKLPSPEPAFAPAGHDREWVEKVRGYMTFGSPIDKHLVMWPRMWDQFHQRTGAQGETIPWSAAVGKLPQAIKWWNYYDEGDPVGFKLDTARAWLIDHGWVVPDKNQRNKDGSIGAAEGAQQPFFDFPEDHDLGFTRYPLPGKAHIDYWNDKKVFGHFISNVIAPQNGPLPVPPTNWLAFFASLILPYIICFLLLCGGTYVLEKNLHPFLEKPVPAEQAKAGQSWAHPTESPRPGHETPAATTPEKEREFSFVAGVVLGIAALLGGLTMMSRVPRLVRPGIWWVVAPGVFVLGCAIYCWNVPPPVQMRLNDAFNSVVDLGDWAVIVVAGVIALVSAVLSRLWPKLGMKPLMILALIATARVAWVRVAGVDKPLWPVVLSGAAFLYLWWLCALIFDLTFVWHRYIRGNESARILKKVRRRRRLASGEISA